MPEELKYKTVSKEILKNSISTALFIDDKALENFKSKNYNTKYKDDHERTLLIHKDLKEKNCLLHSFKFTKSGWKNDKKYYLKNKDLLILDWQLVGTDHKEALKILDYSIKQKSLHFVCIYTQEAEKNVKQELNRYFWGGIDRNKIKEYREKLSETDLDGFWDIDIKESDWIELEEYLDNIINAKNSNILDETTDFAKKYDLSDDIIKMILSIDSYSQKASFEKLKTILKKKDDSEVFSALGESRYYSHSSESEITLYINHTIVKIFNKSSVTGDILYEKFLESFLSSEQNVFFSLMGLEMRNLFKENSAFIGKDFDNISEEAFFFHKNTNERNDFIFTDFLRELMKDQVASFLYERNLELFEVLDEYYEHNGGLTRQEEFIKEENIQSFHEQTFKLNYFYNRLNLLERNKTDYLRFGDIFHYEEKSPTSKGDATNRFFLCITPHCDCLNPTKIDNQFWFIEGKKAVNTIKSRKKVLGNVDGKYISFVKFKNTIEAIYWENSSFECKPKSFFLESNIFKESILITQYKNKKMEFNLIGTLKENYTQRLANRAFGYPIRVGIDFVKK